MKSSTDVAIRRATLLERLDAIATDHGSGELLTLADALRDSLEDETLAAMGDAIRSAGLRLAGALREPERTIALQHVRTADPDEVAMLLPAWSQALVGRLQEEGAHRKRSIPHHLLEQVARELEPPTEALETAVLRLRRLDLELEADRAARSVLAAADSLRLLLNDLIDLASLGAGSFAPADIDFRVRDCVVAALDGLRPRATREGVELRLDISDKVPETVRGDPGRLRQVLHTLVGNALGSGGAVSVRIEGLQEPDASGLSFVVRSRDGDATLPVRRDSGAWVWRGGARTGLGLAIARLLVERLGGKTWVGTAPDGGSEIHIEVPVRASEDYGPTDTGDLDDEPSLFADVLLYAPTEEPVDDVIEQLQRIGIRVAPSTTQTSARGLLRQQPFDAVLICAPLSTARGRAQVQDLVGTVRAEERVPIGLMVRNGHRGDAAFCRAAGLAAYLVRPCSDRDVADTLRALRDLGSSLRRHVSKSSEEPLVTRHFLRESRRRLQIAVRGQQQGPTTTALERMGHRVIDGDAIESADLLVLDAGELDDPRAWLRSVTADLQPGRRPPVLAVVRAEASSLGLPSDVPVDEIALAPLDEHALHSLLPQLRSGRREPPREPTAVLELGRIAAHIGADEDFARDLLTEVGARALPLLGEVAGGLARNDLAVAARAARTLGMALAGIGLRALSTAALELSTRCAAGDRLTATELLRDFRPRLEATAESIRVTLAGVMAPTPGARPASRPH